MKGLIDRIEASGRALSSLSRASDITEARLKEILAGEEPNMGEVRRIAHALRVPVSDLLSTSRENSVAVLFRSTMGKDRTAKFPAIDSVSKKIEHTLSVLRPIESPNLSAMFSGPYERIADAERLAESVRSAFFGEDLASPLLPLPGIAVDAMKIVVMVVPQLKFDGASAVVGDTSFVFISPRFQPRMLFTLAHEICHIIAHHKPGEDFAIADEEERTGSFKHRDPREAFADYFASALLLPRAGVGIALKQIRSAHSGKSGPLGDVDILYLSHIFGVSFLAAAIRCENLELLPKGGGFSIYKELCKEHGSPEGRARELELPERPKVDFPGLPSRLLEDVIEKIKQGNISIGKASSLLNIPIAELLRAHRGVTP